MTIRKVTSKHSDGTESERWMVDVQVEHADGRVERVRKVSPIQSKRGAEQYEQEVRANLLFAARRPPPLPDPPPRPPEMPTFGEFVEEYMQNHASVRCKPSSMAAKRSVLRCHIAPAVGHLRLDQINRRWADGYSARCLSRGLKPRTINTHLGLVRRVLQIAYEWGVLPTAPPRLEFMKPGQGRTDFLKEDDAEKLLAAPIDEQILAMVRVALRTGLRLGELLALRWEDIDLQTGTLRVERTLWHGQMTGTPKNGKTRHLPLAANTIAALRSIRHLKGPVVFCRVDGRMWSQRQALKFLTRACAAAGIRRVTWHVLRHSFASHLVMQGTPLRVVQELMGHATIEQTMRYSHVAQEVGIGAVARLDLKLQK
jgi:integrase